ncbi:hypothetical protein [Halorubrum sp. CGM4_25_10-8A]|uniref:hypothetical protein n=1 Tax=Halorubrum sp. CGM4_25_10-8A TaxID=2518116 RepID=UPI0018EEC815|nr:hypothetical protein [Halorubrum sp. CGM4_25_10-8A]
MAAPDQHISADTCSRDIDVADETPSPEAVDITTVGFDETSFAVERALCKNHDISIHQSVDAPQGTERSSRDSPIRNHRLG